MSRPWLLKDMVEQQQRFARQYNKGKPQKKIGLFLVTRPLRPYAPPPEFFLEPQ